MKLTMYRGDTVVFDFACKDAAGGPLSLSTGSLTFTAKSSARQADADAVFQKSTDDGIAVTDAVNGLASVTLSPADTDGIYAPVYLVWDLQYTVGLNKYTLLSGDLLVKPDITSS